MPPRTLRRLLTLGMIAIGLLLSVQGWRGRLSGFNYDQIINIEEALRLVHGEGLPRCGGLCSFGSHIPPGTAWLFIPGVLTGEPRLYEVVGPLLLELATLLGLFLLVRRSSNESSALFAVALYALSALGIMFGSSLWPRANPCAYVWMTYFVLLWIERRNAWYLTAAMAVWGIGLLIYLEMAPAGLMFVVAWWIYRPPLRPAALACGLIAIMAIWAPYLSFERQRGFVDLRSQLFSQSLQPQQAKELAAYDDALGSWDKVKQELGDYEPGEAKDPTVVVKSLRTLALRGFFFARNLDANFVDFGLLGIIPAAIFLAAYFAVISHRLHLAKHLEQQVWLTWLGVILLVLGAVANPWVAARLLGKSLNPGPLRIVLVIETIILAAGLLLVWRRRVAPGVTRLEGLVNTVMTDDEATASESTVKHISSHGLAVLLWLVAGPWLGLAILAVNSKYQWGLWPLQLAVVAIVASILPQRWNWPRWAAVATTTLVLITASVNSMTIARIADWRKHGYAGVDSPEIQAADYLAEQIRKEDQPAVKIGYHLFFNGFEAVQSHDRFAILHWQPDQSLPATALADRTRRSRSERLFGRRPISPGRNPATRRQAIAISLCRPIAVRTRRTVRHDSNLATEDSGSRTIMSSDNSENPFADPLTPVEAECDAAGEAAAPPADKKLAGPTAARSSMWTFVTRIGTMPLGLLTSALVTRSLGTEGRGLYAFLLLLGAFILPCLSFGFGGSIVYFISSARYRLRDVTLSCLAFGLLQGLFNALILLPLWQFNCLGLTAQSIPVPPMVLTLVSLPFQGANLMLQRAVLGNSWFSTNNWLTVATNVLGSLFLLGFVVLGRGGLLGAAMAMLCMQVMVFVLTMAAIVWREPIVWSLDGRFILESLSYGVRIWVGDLATRANLRLDQFVIGFFYMPGMLGIYSVAVTASELLWLIPDSLSLVLFNKIAAEKDLAKRIALTERVHRGLLIIMVVAGAVLALTRTWAIRILGSAAFLDAAQPLLLLIPGTIAMTTTKVITKYTSGSGRPGASSTITVIGTVLSAGLYFALIPSFGNLGAAIASSLGYTLMAVIAVLIYRRMIAPTSSHLFAFHSGDLRFLISQVRSIVGQPKRKGEPAKPANPSKSI